MTTSQRCLTGSALLLSMALLSALLWALAGGVQASALTLDSGDAPRPLTEARTAVPIVLCVAPYGVCGSGCAACLTTIQAAVDLARPGDEVRVGEGVYTDLHARPRNDVVATGVVTQVVSVSQTITLRGGYRWSSPGAEDEPLSILDAGGQGRGFYVTGDISPTIEGFVVTHGSANGLGGEAFGSAGGGIYVFGASALISDCAVVNNDGGRAGGGVALVQAAAILRNSQVQGNVATLRGGGVYVNGPALLQGNTVDTNEATGGTSEGGGVYLAGDAATLRGNAIWQNHASRGGGVAVVSSSPALENNLLADNEADYGGGAFQDGGGGQWTNNVVVHNGLLGGTNGSGLYFANAAPQLAHTTLVSNAGGEGVYGFYSAVALTNTIVATHTIGVGVEGGQVSLERTLWWGNGANVGAGIVHSGDFTGTPSLDGHHVRADSAAIDRGVDTGLATDMDGEPRLAGNAPDLGADEFLSWGMTLYPHRAATALPGQVVTFSHSLANSGNYTDAYDLALTSAWGTLLTPTPLTMGRWSTATVQVRVAVPGQALSGTVQVGLLIAASRSQPLAASARETTTVALGGSVVLYPDRAGFARCGQDAVYTHTLVNGVNYTQTFSLLPQSSQGWRVTWPYTPPTLPPFGQATVPITLSVPSNAVSGTVDATTLFVTGSLLGAALAQDTTTVVPHTIYAPSVRRNVSTAHLVGDAPDDCPGLQVNVGELYREDFDHANDNDWYAFVAEVGVSYTLRTLDLGPRADTVLALYAPDCSTLLATNDDQTPGDPSSRIEWTAPADGAYCVLVRGYDWAVYGPGTDYTLEVR